MELLIAQGAALCSILVFSSYRVYRAASCLSRSIYELRLYNLIEISTLETLPHLDPSKCHSDRGFISNDVNSKF